MPQQNEFFHNMSVQQINSNETQTVFPFTAKVQSHSKLYTNSL